ncbi:MAG: hypothetical protein JKY45_03260 [Emcibacter sp.]|nr:hypothetical protein [Emcibacter sp.]
MEISEDIQNLYDFVATERTKHGGQLMAGPADKVLDKLFAIHRQIIVSEARPIPAPNNVIKLDARLLAAGGTIKTYRRKSALTPILTFFKRPKK